MPDDDSVPAQRQRHEQANSAHKGLLANQRTPQPVLARMAECGYKTQPDWHHWHRRLTWRNHSSGGTKHVYNVLTVEREYGAGGSLVAGQLAKRLRWELLDQKLTTEIARLASVDRSAVARCDEHLDPLTLRLAKVFWRGSHERRLPLDEDKFFDTDAMVRLATKIIEDAGTKGKCVIVGRGAPYILRNRPDVFHVFCYGSRECKVERLLSHKMPKAEAENLVEVIDSERIAFVKRYFGMNWPTRSLYNIMINTDPGIETAVELVLSAMQITAAQQQIAK